LICRARSNRLPEQLTRQLLLREPSEVATVASLKAYHAAFENVVSSRIYLVSLFQRDLSCSQHFVLSCHRPPSGYVTSKGKVRDKSPTARAPKITGNPDGAYISRSYAERTHLTMRMSMRRFTRLTNGFSKKVDTAPRTSSSTCPSFETG
jgi:hypothetical protein